MENRKAVSFKMEQDKWTKLKIMAMNKNIKLNTLLEEMVNEYIERNGVE